MGEVLIWATSGREADTARRLLSIAGVAGVSTNTDWGTAFVVSEEAAAAYYGEAAAFDPGEHSVSDVLRYLRNADEFEQDRVIEVENLGKGRRTILSWGTP